MKILKNVNMKNRMIYEVETRVYFNSKKEVFNKLPFLQECLKKEIEFETRMYGLKLFNADKILRVSDVKDRNITKVYLGYKEPDIGKIFNIRNEIDEEITCGINKSFIMKLINGIEEEINIKNINQILEVLGYEHFMLLTGTNLTGHSEKLQIDFKLMSCPVLKYPLLLEIEKSAKTLEEAFTQELILRKFIEEYKLENRIVYKEPPNLLETEI